MKHLKADKERILKNATNQSLANALYGNDAESNIKKLARNLGNHDFSYDKLYRVKTTDIPATNPVNDETFGYDDVCNLTNHATQAGQSATTETLPERNRYDILTCPR